MRLGNIKIGVRLALGFGLVLALMVAIIIVGVTEIKQVNDKLERIVNVNNAQVNLAADMLDSVHVVSRCIRSITLVNDMSAKQKEKEKIDDARKQYNEAEQKIEKMISTEDGKAVLSKAKQLKEQSREVNDRIINLAMSNNHDGAVNLLMEADPVVNQWRSALRELDSYANSRTAMRYEEAKQNYQKALMLMVAIGAAAIVLGLLIAVFLTRSIVKPVSRLMVVANTAASGDLTS